MVNLGSATLLVNIISFFMAYLFVISVSGCFRAWVAARMGDHTAEASGFLTLNPVMHMSPLGLLFFAFYAVGFITHMPLMWGKHVPINPFNIIGKRRSFRLGCAYFSDTLLHIVLAITILLVLIVWFDPTIISIIRAMVLTRNVSHLYIAHYYPLYSSLSVVLAFILAAAVTLHTGLAVLELLLNGCMLGLYLYMGPSMHYMQYSLSFMLFAPLLIFMFFYGPLLLLVTNLISYAGYILAYLVNAI